LAPLSRTHLPRTVRFRLTALYGALFLASGTGLLAITYGLAAGRPISEAFRVAGTARGVVILAPGTAQALLSRGPVANPSALPGSLLRTLRTVPPPGVPSVLAARPASGTFSFVGFQATLPTPGELHRLLMESAVALAIMAVVSIGLGWLVAGRVLRPLRTMTATARHISEENLNQRLAVPGPDDELKDLGDTIDGLLARLETAFQAQRRFVANASHELRTPLAMMRTSLDVALGKPSPVPPEVTVLAGKLSEGLDQADRLLEGLLLLARAQQGPLGEVADVSLAGLVVDALDAERSEIARMGLAVQDNVEEVDVMGNGTLLARMVANVVDNAVRHNVPGGEVRISSERDGAKVRLVVESSGPAIDEQQAQQLGEPFYRLGSERVARGDGTGLGLSIVRAIAAAHGGLLVLHARPGGGLRAVLELSAAPARVGG
jgi:hypothetical protein